MVICLLPIFQVSSKNRKLFVADFSDFYLAVSASVNDAKYQKPNSFITPMIRDIGQNMLPAVKIIMKSLDPLRAKKIFIRKKLGHTTVSAIKASSVTLQTWQKEPVVTTVLQFLT